LRVTKGMDFINELSSKVNQFLSSNKNLLDESNETINVKAFESREKFIYTVDTILNSLADITINIETTLARAKNIQSKEISVMNSLFNKLNKKQIAETEWKTVVTKPRNNEIIKLTTNVNNVNSVHNPHVTNNVQMVKTDKPTYSRVKFTEALSLPAIKVPTFDYVKQDGELYYVECAEHFAIMISGKLLHGNIGTIYTDERNPEKIKDCKFATNCMKQDKCDYYHSPTKFHGSRDHRNYIASSWLYTPANSQYNRPRSRRFGSRDHLDTDIVGLQSEEIERFHDQAMHDLLCSLLLDDAYRQK
ncbi:Zinc finger, CCCH-type, partial [Pacmanvirus A23]|uniref:Zinc finger, CCCH-type n=1 Tax=Pacmanvirus A23 TaxID=1932881 RepID=UPI000A0935B9